MFGFASGGTHWKTYLEYTKFLGGDIKRQFGSSYEMTIYWQMLSRRLYHKQWFVNGLKLGMLGLNIWFFFIR